MQEGIQLPELLARIKVLREAGLRAEHMAFSFMKRKVQPLMARDTLGFEYAGDDDTSPMPGGEVDDDESSIGHATIHGVPSPGVLRRAPAKGGK
jgi:hypothetical protein